MYLKVSMRTISFQSTRREGVLESQFQELFVNKPIFRDLEQAIIGATFHMLKSHPTANVVSIPYLGEITGFRQSLDCIS
jgi:hypothetical protein